MSYSNLSDNIPAGVRVDHGPFAGSEAVSAAKTEGNALAQSACGFSNIRKRAYKRALRRAQAYGSTMYRGRLLTSQVLLPMQDAPKQMSSRPRVEMISWNVDGLTDTLYAELQKWLRDNPNVNLVMLQETHWTFTGEWSQSGWNYCHCSGGVLIGLRDSFFPSSCIKWADILQGHLMHVRCEGNKQQFDLLCVYQHALGVKEEKAEGTFKKRERVWQKLDQWLSSTPIRSDIVVAGDLNITLRTEARVSGQGIPDRKLTSAATQDLEILMKVLARHKLCAINTWSRKAQAYTYAHPTSRSQIDYILVRQAVADAEAKRCRPQNTEMAGWRKAGHLLLRGSIPARWTPWQKQTGQQTNATLQGVDISRLYAMDPDNVTLQEMRDAVQMASSPPRKKGTRPQLAAVDREIECCWKIKRDLLALRRRRFQHLMPFRLVFAAFRLRTAYGRAHRELKRALRARKRTQLLEMLDTAEQAAKNGDSRTLFSTLRLVCPTRSVQRVRLRNSEGWLISAAEECKMLTDYASKLFSGPGIWEAPLQPIPEWKLADECWLNALHEIKAEKAVPAGQPPIKTWKEHPAQVAKMLGSIARRSLCGQNPCIPQDRACVQIAWLPKPGKSPSIPKNLRSIGLMAADTKLFMTVIKNMILHQVNLGFCEIPQYAYRQNAGTSDALMRGGHHCRQVRDSVKHLRSDHTSKIIGVDSSEIRGGTYDQY